jgi:hypothetical protein
MSWLDDELNGTKTKESSSGTSWLDEELAKTTQKPKQTPSILKQRTETPQEQPKETKRDYTYFGQEILPVKESDPFLAKAGKDILNYGLGTVGRIFSAPQQALMQADRAAVNALTGKKQDFSEMTFGKDILGAKKDNLLTTAIGTALDPATYIGGGIVDDMARVGRFGQSARLGTTENLMSNATRGQRAAKGLPKAAGDTVREINPQRFSLLDETEDATGKYAYVKNNNTGAESFIKLDDAKPKLELPDPQSKIVSSNKSEPFSFKNAWDKFYTRIVDTNKPGQKVGNEFYTKATNSKSVSGIVDHNLTQKLVDKKGDVVGDSLETVARQIPKGKENDFWTYMSQRHNIDRAREGKPVQANYTPEMSAEAARRYEAANPEYKKIGDNITNWIDTFMKTWGVDTGIADKDIYSQLRQTYKSYFPTQRDFSTLEKSIPNGMSSKFVDQRTPIRTATGSERDIVNPLENIMNLVNRTIRTAKYNDVGKSLLDAVRAKPELKALAEIVPDGNLDNVVTVLENGKPVYLKINDKPLLDLLNGLPKSTLNVKVLSDITNVFKGLITQKNPIFAVRNIFKDTPTSYVYGSTKNPIKFAKDLGGAFKDITTNSANFQRYKAVGGGGGNFFNSSNVARSAEQLIGKEGIAKKVLGGIEKFNNLTETAPRLAEFNRVFEKTGDVEKALFAANDVSVNFSRGGDITKTLDRNGVAYLNAGVQGLDKFFRGFKNPRTALATITKAGLAISTPEIALYLINKDNPNYQELDNRTKDTYFLIPKQDGTFWKIPKSRELGVLFGSLLSRIARSASGEKEAFKGFGGTLATNFAPTNPIENNILSPITWNLATNKDFAGRAIVPMGMTLDNRSKYLQYDEKTTEISKKIAEYAKKANVDISPKQLDYLIKSYTGVIGQFGIPATTKGGTPLKTLTNQFIADPVFSNQALTDFYSNFDKLKQKASDKNILEKIPSKLVTPEEKIKNTFNKASLQISDINKQIKAETDETKVRELKQQILQIAKNANDMLK